MSEEMSEEKGIAVLDKFYSFALSGIGKEDTIKKVADYYLSKNNKSIMSAIKDFTNVQTLKCATTGFLTGLGGLITLPIAIPADVGGVLYVQLRMIMVIAYLGGHDINSDKVKAFVYACLVGMSVNDITKQVGIQMAGKLSANLIKKIPYSVIKQINKAVGFRLVTKAGTKGLVNLTKWIPAISGVIGGAIDHAFTKSVAKRAIEMFIS